MATKKSANHYYVLVFVESGPAYVTAVNHADRTARWDKDKAPLELSKSEADSIVFGLCCNFFNAVVVYRPVEIDCQPYNYRYYDCQFVMKPEEPKSEDAEKPTEEKNEAEVTE